MNRVNTFTVNTDEEAYNMSIALLARSEKVALYKIYNPLNSRFFWFVVATLRLPVIV